MAASAQKALSNIARHFDEDGYAVVPGLISADAVHSAATAWRSEIKPYRGLIYRQSSGIPERNQSDAYGHIMNPLWNLQSLDRGRFPGLTTAALDIFAAPDFQIMLTELVGERAGLVQSMFFEGNPVTPAHQDLHYLDAVDGQLVGAWVALEDVHADAGRFFVYPGSHREDVTAPDEHGYLPAVAERIAGLAPVAPALAAGDVLFWHPGLIHGSLPTKDPSRSRLSMTGHFMPPTSRLRSMERVSRMLRFTDYRGLPVHRPKDQNTFVGRALLLGEAHLPTRVLKQFVLGALPMHRAVQSRTKSPIGSAG